MKKKYWVFSMIFIFLVVIGISYYINRHIKVSDKGLFKEIYNSGMNTEDISVYINKRVTNEKVKVVNSDDVKYIFETINNEYIKHITPNKRLIGFSIVFK